jgi:hypothetical protein
MVAGLWLLFIAGGFRTVTPLSNRRAAWRYLVVALNRLHSWFLVLTILLALAVAVTIIALVIFLILAASMSHL